MATDYDAPRATVVTLADDSWDNLAPRRDDTQSAAIDVDDAAESFELPGAEVLDDELTVAVIPMRGDEFRCSRCFLVHHRSQLAARRGDEMICRECG